MIPIKDAINSIKNSNVLSKYSKETIEYVSNKNREFNKVASLISKIANLRVEVDHISHEIKSSFSQLKHQISGL